MDMGSCTLIMLPIHNLSLLVGQTTEHLYISVICTTILPAFALLHRRDLAVTTAPLGAAPHLKTLSDCIRRSPAERQL